MEFARHNLQVNTIVPEAIEVALFHTPNYDQAGTGPGILAGRAEVRDNVRSLAVLL